jgi:NAD(P)-dependent dehydrogenase (short-subunit alcohol dehydrogenase family)
LALNSADPDDAFLTGTAALVTGSARGLGAAIAHRLAVCGADIALHYRSSKEECEALAVKIRSMGRRCIALQADLDHAAQGRLLVREAAAALGRMDHLVYNVGPFLTRPFLDLSEAEWDSIMNANLKSAWATAAEAWPWLRESGQGHVVMIAANSAYIRTHPVYGMAKAALIHLSEALAVEMGPQAAVNCIAPGMVEGSQPDEATGRLVLDRTPLKRLVTAEEIAEMCAIICSPAFRSVTGRTIVMDGGRWLR